MPLINIKNRFSSLLHFLRQDSGLPIWILLFYAAEASTKILQYNFSSFYNVSAVIKALFMVVAVIKALKYLDKYRKSLLVFITSMLILFLMGQLAFNSFEWNTTLLFKNGIYLGRYLLLFALLLYFNDPYKIKFGRSAIFCFEGIVLINSFFVIIGAIGDIYIFNTYQGDRFGFNGLFLVSSMGTYFYAIAISYYLTKIKKEKKGYVAFLVILIASFLVGTKALYLFIVLSCLLWIIYHRWYLLIKFWAFVALAFLALVVFLDKIQSLLFKNEVLYELYSSKGLVTMATSYRNENLMEVFREVIIDKWDTVNYLIGGTDFTKYRIEFDFLDVLLFLGLVGGLVYFWFYFSFAVRLKMFLSFERGLIIMLLFIALLSGTFFNNGVVPLYLLVLLNFLKADRWRS